MDKGDVMSDSREAFEKWAASKMKNFAGGIDLSLVSPSGHDGWTYATKAAESSWRAWQASRQALEEQGYLNERAQFAEKDAKLLDEMAEELRSLNWAIEACGRDGKIEYEKACQLAKKVIKAAANYL